MISRFILKFSELLSMKNVPAKACSVRVVLKETTKKKTFSGKNFARFVFSAKFSQKKKYLAEFCKICIGIEKLARIFQDMDSCSSGVYKLVKI